MYIKSVLRCKTLLQSFFVTLVEFKNVVGIPHLPPEGNGEKTVQFSLFILFF